MLYDEELRRCVHWPRPIPDTESIRRILRTVRRFIDLDGTLIVEGGRIRPVFDGVPTPEFLAEEPYVIQTWNPDDAVQIVDTSPDLPPPVLIIQPPLVRICCGVIVRSPEQHRHGGQRHDSEKAAKDFEALGVAGVTIYDDTPEYVHAPGCTIINATWG
ncbi:MAG: hypothetical protein V1723_03210 [Candidatus Uhrbacteria bacterium]